MLVSPDSIGVRAERAERQGIRKTKAKKERSPTVIACKRTPPTQLSSELCHLTVEKKPSPQVDEVFCDEEQASQVSITSGSIRAAITIKRSRSPTALCEDGLQAFEKEIWIDFFQYMLEKDKQTRPSLENMDLQPEIRWDMRTLLVDFLIQIHGHFGLRTETIHLAINLLDRYMSKAVVVKKHYQLVGMCCLWIAAKFEDGQEKVPRSHMLCHLSCYLYDSGAFVTMERHVLKTLGWDIGHPTADTFLQCYLTFSIGVSRLRQVARFLMEVTLYGACFLSFGSHTIATSCLFAARRILGIPRGLLSENDERVPCLRELENSLRYEIPLTIYNKYNVYGNMRASVQVRSWLESNPCLHFVDDLGATSHPQPIAVLSPVNFNIDRPFVLPGEGDHIAVRELIHGVEQSVREDRTLVPRPFSLPPIQISRSMISLKGESGRQPR